MALGEAVVLRKVQSTRMYTSHLYVLQKQLSSHAFARLQLCHLWFQDCETNRIQEFLHFCEGNLFLKSSKATHPIENTIKNQLLLKYFRSVGK